MWQIHSKGGFRNQRIIFLNGQKTTLAVLLCLPCQSITANSHRTRRHQPRHNHPRALNRNKDFHSFAANTRKRARQKSNSYLDHRFETHQCSPKEGQQVPETKSVKMCSGTYWIIYCPVCRHTTTFSQWGQRCGRGCLKPLFQERRVRVCAACSSG